MPMILHLLRVGIRQPRKASHVHPDLEIHSLRIARRNMLAVWITCDPNGTSPTALSWAIASCGALLRGSCVNLLQHGIIDLRSERTLNGSQIWFMSIGREL